MERIVFKKQGKAQNVTRCGRCDFFIETDKILRCSLPRDVGCQEGVYVRVEESGPEPETLSLSDATILFKVMHENRMLLAMPARDELYERLRLRLTSALPAEVEDDAQVQETIKCEECGMSPCSPRLEAPHGWEQFTPPTGERTRYTCPSCIVPF